MINETLILISIDMCRPIGGHRDPNAIAAQCAVRFFFQTGCQKMGVVSM